MKRSIAGVVFASFAAAAFAQSVPAPAAALREKVRSWRGAHERQILREYFDLVAIPNLASDAANIEKNAQRIAAMLEARGVKTRLLDGEGGPPVVYGELSTPGARNTVVVYAHYDGQPVDPAQWKTAPWQPVLRDGVLEDGAREIALDALTAPLGAEWRVYGRSTSDDKAPAIALVAALDALAAAKQPLSVNLKVFYEGEEEAGSPHLARVLEKHKELLRGDLWLLCDGPVHQTRRPQVYFGARGVTGVEITLYGPKRTLHSGHYGNWAPNPAVLAAQLVSSMRDADGRILIEGYSNEVRPPTAAERKALAAVPDNDAELRRELALGASEASGARLAERILLPALNVRGLSSGHVGERAANAIPTEANISIDFRLVPNQTLARVRELVERHVRAQGYELVKETPSDAQRTAHPRVAKLVWDAGGYPAARTDIDAPVSRAFLKTLDAALGTHVVAMPTLGGSIPMHLFQQILGAPILGLPLANHDNNQHAANENMRLQNLWDGIEAYAGVLALLGPNLDAEKR